MRKSVFEIIEKKQITADVYELLLRGDTSGMTAGQFVEVAVPGHYLRRPFGVHRLGTDTLALLFRVVGGGTQDMASLALGDSLELLTQLGCGFDLTRTDRPLLIGGGLGVAPLLELAAQFAARGTRPVCVLGYRNAAEVMLVEEFSRFADVYVVTDDGSVGIRGNAVTALSHVTQSYDYYYACGPMVMLRALQSTGMAGEVSLEARMGCGFGACMGCTIMTTQGAKRVCKEGPVFSAEEVVYQ